MTGLKEAQLFKSFANKEYRDAFVAEQISTGLAYQIRAIREKYGWTQQELADRADKAQETISQLENPDYGRFTLKTLKTLASAFDLALMVKFVSFRDLIHQVSNLSPEKIAPPSYEGERQMSFNEITGSEVASSADWPEGHIIQSSTSRVFFPGAGISVNDYFMPRLEREQLGQQNLPSVFTQIIDLGSFTYVENESGLIPKYHAGAIQTEAQDALVA
jgi:transcriptional regulator with XRE-family HTH domain